MSSANQVLEELFGNLDIVSLDGVVLPEAADVPMYESLDYSWWVGGVWWDVQVKVHGLLVSTEREATLGGDRDGKVEKVDRGRWRFYLPYQLLGGISAKVVHGVGEFGEEMVI
jgi:hypothetical protein